jgi:CheY-like chemotaxis protein
MKRTILLADDSPTIQRLVTQTFAGSEFTVVSVSNGEAAIKKFDSLRPSIVLADIYMPGRNGYEVCAFVRNHASLANTPVILLVGAFDVFDEENAKRVGASANITKPFEPHALVEMVESMAGPAPPEIETQPAPEAAPVARPEAPETADLLGLESIFKAEIPQPGGAMNDADVDRIADRVIQRLSAPIIENIAWDVVPDIAEKIVREELRRAAAGLAAKKHEG